MGAAYKLAALGQTDRAIEWLEKGLYSGRESVRRAATCGLIAVGNASAACFLRAVASPAKWVRKAGVHGLGDAADLSGDVLEAVAAVLQGDSSVHVRSVAAGTIGCLGRRAAGSRHRQRAHSRLRRGMTASLGREENRPAMDRAQGRSIRNACAPPTSAISAKAAAWTTDRRASSSCAQPCARMRSGRWSFYRRTARMRWARPCRRPLRRLKKLCAAIRMLFAWALPWTRSPASPIYEPKTIQRRRRCAPTARRARSVSGARVGSPRARRTGRPRRDRI